jgi:hypothetical protein
VVRNHASISSDFRTEVRVGYSNRVGHCPFLAAFPWIGIWFVKRLWPSVMESENETVRALPAPARRASTIGQVFLWFGFGLWATFGLRVMHGALLLIFLVTVALWFASVLTYRKLAVTKTN